MRWFRRSAPVETARAGVKYGKRVHSQKLLQDGGSNGGGDLRNVLKKMRSIKAMEGSIVLPLEDQLVQFDKPATEEKMVKKKKASATITPGSEPNYMKLTQSSSARREKVKVQVIDVSPAMAAAEKRRNPRPAKVSEPPKRPSGDDSNQKPAKVLTRKLSLRATRPLMREKSFSIGPARGTCSSTMKHSKFPNRPDPKSRLSEAEKTSILQVCPFNYCSLNGHHHPPLPTLRRLVSGRRQLLKNQSMKLRGLSSFKRRGSNKKKEVEMGEDGCEDDFFVEIYVNCGEGPAVSASDEVGEKDSRASEIWDDVRASIDDSGSEVTLNNDFDPISVFSSEEMDVLNDFLQFVECSEEAGTELTENPSFPKPNSAGTGWRCCILSGSDELNGSLPEDDGHERGNDEIVQPYDGSPFETELQGEEEGEDSATTISGSMKQKNSGATRRMIEVAKETEPSLTDSPLTGERR
ncbi:unnamed protein product [Spirodela intermedia]|uniref:Uncharacterized protein n=2 Tax=Spirodela intermedia TaxID=51605 RepID=A0A7I8JHV2_SPIIN|nr:unnamed protein product [Spirodela intermedia]CAA6669012.1 unnamed protein product [Spirodela intermedia]CAA7405957.1 unnamed protein product [Spirodela intermedia]